MGKIYVPGQAAANTAGYRSIRFEPVPGGYVRVHDERTGATRMYSVEELRERMRSLEKSAQEELYASERAEILRAISAIAEVCRRAELMDAPTRPSIVSVPPMRSFNPKIIRPGE